MDKATFDRIVKTQMVYWLVAMFFSVGLALFAKLIWTHKFPILLFMPIMFIAFTLGSIGALKKELSGLVTEA